MSDNYFYFSEGWVKTDLSFIVRKWVERKRLNHAIQIECSTCEMERNVAPVSIEQTLKPFLVIHTSPLPQKNRPKRNTNCLPEMKECCRDELYISFEDIGWSDWILHPSGYHAYFCRGTCSSAASLTVSGTPYNNVIRVRVLTIFLQFPIHLLFLVPTILFFTYFFAKIFSFVGLLIFK